MKTLISSTAIAQKLDELLRFAKQTRATTEEIHRAVDSMAGDPSRSMEPESTGSDRTIANSMRPWNRKGAALVVQALLALFTFGALMFTAASYNLSRSMGQKQLRAWITIYDVRLVRDFSTTGPTAVDISAKNTGQTPALNLEWTFDTGSAFSEGHCHLKADTVVSASRGAIGPGEVITNAGIRINPLLQLCLDDLKMGTSVFSVRGTIRYEDIFGERHFTNFCFHTTKLSTQILTACEDHNDLN